MNSVDLIFLRHGESLSTSRPQEACPSDDSNVLTAIGRMQIGKAVARLARSPNPTTVLSSSAPRSIESASIAAKELGVQWEVDERLKEIVRVQSSRPQDDVHREIVSFWRAYYGAAQNEKAQIPAVAEAKDLLREICFGDRPSRFLLVGHGGKLELLTALLLAPRDPTDALIEFRLGCARFHHIQVLTRGSEIVHKRVHCLNS